MRKKTVGLLAVMLLVGLLGLGGLILYSHLSSLGQAPEAGRGREAPRRSSAPGIEDVLVQGWCRDLRGQPVEDVQVLVLPIGVWAPRILSTRCHEQGRFVLRAPFRWAFFVEASGPRCAWTSRVAVARKGRGGRWVAEVSLICRPPGVLVGRVVSSEGEPIPGARIRLVPAGSRDLPPRVLLAGPDGVFRAADVAVGTYDLLVSARGHVRRVVPAVEVPARVGDVVLTEAGGLSGRVTYQGKPVPGAEVTLVGSGVWPARRTRTDGDGTFRFEAVPEGVYELQAHFGGARSRVREGVVVQGKGQPQVDLVLERGVRLEGQVLDSSGKVPVPQAAVALSSGSLLLSAQRVLADDKGRFELPAVLPGRHHLSVDAPGRLPLQGARIVVSAKQCASRDRQVQVEWVSGPSGGKKDLQEPVSICRLRVRLERGAVLAGRVLDDVGRPVSGARLELVYAGRGIWAGIWSQATLLARQASFQTSVSGKTLSWGTGGGLLESLGVTSGPVPGIHGQSGAPSPAPAAGGFTTDASGLFRIEGLPPGSAVLVVSHPRYAARRAGPFRLVVGRERKGVEVVLRPGKTLAGEVRDDRDTPLARVFVLARDELGLVAAGPALTDKDGRFALPNLTGRVFLEIARPGYLKTVLGVTIPRDRPPDRVRVELLPASGVFEGEVTDPRGLGVSGAVLELVSLDPRHPGRLVGVTDERGEFRIRGAGKVAYQVRVTARGYPPLVVDRVPLNRRARFVLRFGGGIQGFVRDDATGAACQSAEVRLVGPAGPPRTQVFPRGRFLWKGLVPGRYRIEVRCPGYSPKRLQVKVPPGTGPDEVTVRDLEVRLVRAGRIRGFVRDDRSFPVARARVTCSYRDGQAVRGETGRDGTFLLEAAPVGRCRLVAVHPIKGRSEEVEVDVRAGEDTPEVVLELAGEGPGPESVRAGVAVVLAARDEEVVVTAVTAGSKAEAAGLRVGDVLVSIDGEPVEGEGLDSIQRRLAGPAGSTVILQVERAGRRLTLPVVREILGE